MIVGLVDGGDVVWRFLIDVVVKPVCEEKVGVCPPCDKRPLVGVVVAVIVARHLNGQTLVEVAAVLCVKSEG